MASSPPPRLPERPTAAPPPFLHDDRHDLEHAPPPQLDDDRRRLALHVPLAPATSAGADEFIRRLRLISAEARDLQKVLRTIRDGEVALARYAEYVGTTYAQLDELLNGLPEDDDCVRHIQNTWEQMRTCRLMREPGGEFEPQEQLQLLHLLDQQCRQIAYWTAHHTVPARLRDWLSSSARGYAVPFHAVFDDEIPEAEDRQKILNHLAWSPALITRMGGVVDVGTGLVYRWDANQGPLRRYLPVLAIGVTVAGFAALAYLRFFGIVPGNHDARTFLVGWMAVMAGLLIHVLVGVSKQTRAAGAVNNALPVSHALLLLNARLPYVLVRIGSAFGAYLGLLYALPPDASNLNSFLFNALLVGYSLDSIVELFGNTLDQRAAAQQANLTRRLAPGG